ncbi:MAG: ABC transporter permease [Solirubrobacterales bacterium]|nr:ABC transporter permease [Solirubrobacterales bacterium]
MGQAIIVLLGVTVITFLLLDLLNTQGGGVARQILGSKAPQSQLIAWNHQNGFDKPFYVQFWKYLTRLLSGNLGYSYHYNQSVSSLLSDELPRDIVLGGISLILSLAIAIPVGVAQAVKRNKPVDHGLTAVSFVLYSMPPYAVAILLVQIFAISTHVFPATVTTSGNGWSAVFSDFSAQILPIISLTLVSYAYFSRYMRSSAIDTLAQDYIRTARAKGLSERMVLSRHLLRNSLLTVITLVGLSLPVVITGTVITESVFNDPGVGFTYVTAAQNYDYEYMLTVTVLVGVLTVLGNLLADMAYAMLDPRIRY